MVQGGMSLLKYLMFVFNFVFVVCGIILIVIGAIVQRNGSDLTEFLGSKYVTAPTIIIVVGIIIFVIAFLGCCGAIRENSCMVTTFGALLFIIFVVEVAGGIVAYTYRNQFEDFLKKNMNDSIAQQKADSNKIWEEMQQRLKCCGVSGSEDYPKNNLTIPDSCCDHNETQGEKPCTAEKAYKTGCYKELYNEFKDKITMVGGAAIGIAVIELLGCMFAWCLSSAIKKEYEGV